MGEHDLHAIAFPRLDDSQIATLVRCAHPSLKRYRDGEVLFHVGDRDFKFFIVKSGEVEIVDQSGDTPKTVTVHRPGEFTGDVSHLTGSPSVVSAIARGECEVYEVSADVLRQVLNRSPQLGDLILQAFIARRQLLRESGEFTGLRVIGSRYSRDTFRIREFLAKNRVLFTWIDLETAPEVDRLLKQFGVSEAETPVVACGRMTRRISPNGLGARIAGRRASDWVTLRSSSDCLRSCSLLVFAPSCAMISLRGGHGPHPWHGQVKPARPPTPPPPVRQVDARATAEREHHPPVPWVPQRGDPSRAE